MISQEMMISRQRSSWPGFLKRAGLAFQLLMLVGMLSIASGAHAGTNLGAPNLTVPQRWSITDKGVVTQSIEVMSQWWERLGDSTLSDLILQSLKNNPDVRIAQSKLRQSRAQRALASSKRFPTLSASGSATRSDTSVPGSSAAGEVYSAEGGVSWDADIFGATRSGLRAAKADYRATEADLHNAQVSLAAEVGLDYVQFRAYQARLDIARRNEASQSETLQITQWREQAGLVGSVDVEQARANRDQTRAQIPSLEINIAQTQHAMELLVGVAPGTLKDKLAATAPIPSPPDQVAIGIPADTLRQRPDIQAAEQRILAETARTSQQHAARYPSLNLTGSLGVEALSGALTGGTSTITSLVASLSQTIFDGGRIRHQIEIQSAVQEQAVLTYESAVLTALKDVENALVSFANTRERLASLNTADESAQKAALLAKNRYSAGLVDFQTVLDSERTALTIEDNLATTQSDRTSSLIQLYKALGGGWSQSAGTSARGK